MGNRPEEMLARADEIRYPRKRASKKVRAPSQEEVASQPALQEVKQVPLQVLVDLTCPHCEKKNSFAVIQEGGPNQALRGEVLCAHRKKASNPAVFGPIMAGPFPK